MFDTRSRYWLLTWTTYGTWLPGDDKGFVSPVRNPFSQKWERQNTPGTICTSSIPGLRQASYSRLKCPAISLSSSQAEVLWQQFQETANIRNWQILSVAIMRTHVHLLVYVENDPAPENVLRDFKAYGSRSLNSKWQKPASGTWWTESGSKRKKATQRAVVAAVRYVANQANPLLVWIHSEWRHVLEEARG